MNMTHSTWRGLHKWIVFTPQHPVSSQSDIAVALRPGIRSVRWTDFLRSKFHGNIGICSLAKPWSFAHFPHVETHKLLNFASDRFKFFPLWTVGSTFAGKPLMILVMSEIYLAKISSLIDRLQNSYDTIKPCWRYTPANSPAGQKTQNTIKPLI